MISTGSNKVLLFIINLFFIQGVLCQSPNYFTLGEKEFSDKEIYSLLYDDNTDILYLATDNGVFQYRKNQFLPIHTPKEATATSFFDLKQKSSGEIFCSNLNGQIFEIQGNKLDLYYHEKRSDKIHYTKYYIDNNDDIVIVSYKSILLVDKFKKTHDLLAINKLSDTNFYFQSHNQSHSGEIFIFTGLKKNKFEIKNRELKRENIYDDLNKPLSIKLKDKSYVKDLLGNIHTNQKKLKHIFGYNEAIFPIGSNLLLGISKEGDVSRYSIENNHLSKKIIFKNKYISTLAKNKSGTYFFGTLKSGLLVVHNLHQASYELNDEYLTDIATDGNNTVYISSRSGALYKIDSSRNIIKIQKINREMNKIFYAPGIKKNLPQYNNDILFECPSCIYLGFLKDGTAIDSSMFCYADLHYIYFISTDKYSYHSNTSIKNRYKLEDTNNQGVNKLCYSRKDSILYFTSGTNLCSKKLNQYNYQSKIIKNGINVLDLEYYQDKLYCGTEKNGLLIFENKKLRMKLTTQNGLLSNKIIKVRGVDNYLIILNDLGLQLYDISKNKVYDFGRKEGLDTDNIVSFEIEGNSIWVITKRKVYNVDIHSLFMEPEVGNLIIDSLYVNNKLVNSNQNKFYYNDRNFEFFYDYRDIESKNKVKIKYTIEGYFNEWKELSPFENKFDFETFPVGKYKLKFLAEYLDQKTSTEEFSFEVLPPFWQRWWFYLIVFSAMTLLYYLFFKRNQIIKDKRNKEILEKEILSRKLIKNQLKALRSQMNPHFIFNSLNSIQHFILKEEIDISYDYITMFSKLVRNTLNFSEKDFISLIDEIEFLNIYLSLEKLRFGEDFNFSIENNVGSESMQVPSLIIQPFIENALLHGLLHKQGDKYISIKFNFINNRLTCTIQDNGVGRKRATEIKVRQKQGHESFSTKAISERLKILSEKLGQEVSFKYIDLFDQERPKGTKVEIVMPYK